MRRHAKALSTESSVGRRRIRGPIVALAALVLVLTLVPLAHAEKGVVAVFGDAQGSGNGEFGAGVGQIALNQDSGAVYVVDPGNDRVQRFDADGAFLGAFGGTGTANGQFESPTGIAVDNSGGPSDGSVYVADMSGNRIQKFDAAGNFVLAFGSEGPGDGELLGPNGIAVDPTDGSILVADTGNGRVQRFGSGGAYVSQFSAAASKVAVDSTGDIYVLSDFSEVNRYDSTGSFEQFLTAEGFPFQVAVDASTNHAYVAQYASGLLVVSEYDESGALVESHANGSGLQVSDASGLAINPATGVAYLGTGANGNATGVYVLDAVTPPTATIAAATGIGAHSATLNGSVNPSGPPTTYRFEFSENGTDWIPGPGGTAGDGSVDVPVSGIAKLLDANTLYHVRLVANHVLGLASSTSAETTFTTLPAAPDIVTGAATVPTDTTATLQARLIPNNSPTTYFFEYGLDDSYGSVVPPSPAGPVGGALPVDVAETISGLTPSTVYHYRVVASNAHGTTIGIDRSFTTFGEAGHGLPEGRVYERVSPSDKNSADIERGSGSSGFFFYLAQPSLSGDAVAYASKGNFGGDSGTPVLQYIARRGVNGWVSEGLSPRTRPATTITSASPYKWLSDDLSLGAVSTHNDRLTPGDPPNSIYETFLYLRDLSRPNDQLNGAFSLMTTPISSAPLDQGTKLGRVADASEDLEQIVFDSSFYLDPEGPDYAQELNRGVYLWENDEAQFVGFLPDGSVPPRSGVGNGRLILNDHPGDNAISDDGSRVFFTADSTVYVRESNTMTSMVGDGEFQGAEAMEGKVAFFTSTSRQTSDATAGSDNCGTGAGGGCSDLYRWDATAPPGEQLTDLTVADPNGGGVLGTIGISDDAKKVYFVATGDLAPGATPGIPNVFLWQEGLGVRHVARLSEETESGASVDRALWSRVLSGAFLSGGSDGGYGGARITDDGAYLLFESRGPVTPYVTNDRTQVYRYDLANDDVTCLSCNRRTSSSQGQSFLTFVRKSAIQAAGTGDPTLFLPRNISSDGSRIFFDSTEALLPTDTNGKVDVYEWLNGELHLISTGSSGRDSTFFGASEDGDDVFFVTGERLARSDGDESLDLYDARVGGAEEPAPIVGCVGDECQGTPTPPPAFSNPSSGALVGPGNPRSPARARSRCRKRQRLSGSSKKQVRKCRRGGKKASSRNG